MSKLQSQALLENASVAISVGTESKPVASRNVFNVLAASAVLIAASAFSPAQAQNYPTQSFEGQSDAQVLSVEPEHLVGEVVSVRQIRENSRRSHRGEISPRSIAGAVIGGAIGNQVGGGNGRKLSTLVGALAGGSVANRIADRRAASRNGGYENARRVQDNELVVVRVNSGLSFETYEIEQPAGFNLRRGDTVALMASKDGKTLMAFPVEIREELSSDPSASRPRSRR